MVAPQEKLACGIDLVCKLRSVTVFDENLADEAWAAVKAGIVVARKDLQAFDQHAEEAMREVLHFLTQKGKKKRTARAQVNECLRILLARPRWLSTAQKNPDLCTSLKEAFAGINDMQTLLDTITSSRPSETQDGRDTTNAVEALAKAKASGISEQLTHGLKIMRSFGWEFPRDPLGTKIDEATEGFMVFCDGITALTTTRGRASIGNDVVDFFSVFETQWQHLLGFLLSMYCCGFRNTYRARIKFVVVSLRTFSPGFRFQKLWKDLPWGDELMPEVEAKEAAEKAAEEDMKIKIVKDDFEFAMKIQAIEEAAWETEVATVNKTMTSDVHLAVHLQRKELAAEHRRTAIAAQFGGC